MPGVGVLFESIHVSYQPGADRIQVDIADKLQKIQYYHGSR